MGWLAAVVGVASVIPQFRRARSIGVDGVSLATWSLFALLGCFWIAYGVVEHSIQLILLSSILLPLQLTIIHQLRPSRHVGVVTRAAGYFVLCCVLPSMIWGWSGGVYGAGVAMTATRLPQLIELVRSRDVSGVSAATWYIFSLCSLLWLGYWSYTMAWAPLFANAAAGVTSLTIAILATYRHMGHRRLSPDAAVLVVN
jgi:uncharacterized protein with PQ loop repeat